MMGRLAGPLFRIAPTRSASFFCFFPLFLSLKQFWRSLIKAIAERRFFFRIHIIRFWSSGRVNHSIWFMWANLIFQKTNNNKTGRKQKQAKKEKRFRNVLDSWNTIYIFLKVFVLVSCSTYLWLWRPTNHYRYQERRVKSNEKFLRNKTNSHDRILLILKQGSK